MQDRKTYGQVTGTPEELQYPRLYLVEAEGVVYRCNRQHLVPPNVGTSDQKRPNRGKQAGIDNRTTMDWNLNLGINKNYRLSSSQDNTDADLDVPAVDRESGGSEVDESEWRGWPGKPTENKNLTTNLRRSTEALHLAHLMAAHGYFFPIDDHMLTVKNDNTFYRFQVS
ncbi:hypothetical protein PR048_014414 [Dryococelus australis]|uniref:Uncharacterized protein n=1 Tax=Dryococelus australis TaxID=614101 RepID=A0ABQ9HE60_9NEOP|nr:hypothetical protein PR048_014414 [Dryococelus australis]